MRWLALLVVGATLAIALMPARGARADEATPAGQQIYRTLCASCHGAEGEGTKDGHPDPLAGDRSILELAKLIEATMPEDAPEKCVKDQARQVAAYIYATFYSPAAQARRKPARIELSRLTVRQYQNVVADLVGSFRGPAVWGEQRGLRGEYFRTRRFRDDERVLDRIDPNVAFDFGVASPVQGKLEPYEFSIRWTGALLATETADYEFIVRTDHATRLWVNDLKQPLIDAWVKSGNDHEYRASLRLIGGRTYSVRLEFSKAKQGVDDSKKNDPAKQPVKPASIGLWWKLPHRAAEPIPSRCLTPKSSPEVFALTTPFPPDDRSVGYERGTTISKEWDQATTDTALEVAGYVTSRLSDSAVAGSAGNSAESVRDACLRFVERAFRRPLTDEQRQLYVDRQLDEAGNTAQGVKRVVLLTLKSPRFLYREPGGAGDDPYNVAARLSFGLWDSIPDEELLRAAAAGELATREQVLAQARRMLPDLRTRAKLHEFFLQWLKVDQVPDLAKDPAKFPTFNETLATDLRTSLEIFLDDVVWSEGSDFRQLLLSGDVPLNGRLAKFYGAALPDDAPFQNVALEKNHRAGLLTHPYLLASFAYTATSSPIHRGVFISRSLLGRSLRPPPEGVAPLPTELHADLTTRERVALQTKSETCMACHGMINPLGYTLEHFDAVGRFRAEELGKPIDATGAYLSRSGQSAEFASVRELAAYLTDSPETHAAFVEQLFQYLIKQPVGAYGPGQLEQLQKSFEKNEYNIRELTAEIVAAAALGRREDKP